MGSVSRPVKVFFHSHLDCGAYFSAEDAASMTLDGSELEGQVSLQGGRLRGAVLGILLVPSEAEGGQHGGEEQGDQRERQESAHRSSGVGPERVAVAPCRVKH
jgi:hypothetical protein